MSLASRTNRWASTVIIVLQLVAWNAVGIILLQRGVSTLRRRILETSYVTEADPSTGLDVESIVSSTKSEYDPAIISAQRQSIDKNIEVIIQVESESSLRDDRNFSGLSAIRSNKQLRDAFEIVSEEQRSTLSLLDPLEVPTTDRGTPSSRLENHLTEIDRHISDRPEDKGTSSKKSRIARDREHIHGNGISGSIQAEEDITSIPDRSGSGITGSVSWKEGDEEEDLNPAENATQTTLRETSPSRGEDADVDQFVDTLWTGKSNVRFSRLADDAATTAAALVAIGAIMLLVGPVVIILRILDERRQARKLIALTASAREDLPPTYEQAVLMGEAPRYSTLALNDDDHTPPSWPLLSSTRVFIERRDVVVS